jgi:8-oxo-dGTP pyrophosphatase MutT (NUDIX family)
MDNPLLFEISVTAIIRRIDGRFLLLRRSGNKKRFPNKWTVPGGHVERKDYIYQSPNPDGWWYGVLEDAVRREVKEEAGVHIKNIRYLTSMVTEHKGSVIVISMVADLDGSDSVTFNEDESSDFVWANATEAESIDLIAGIHDELILASQT